MNIRRPRPSDTDDLYAVCLGTGDSGKDATGMYDDPRLLGEVFVGPYLVHEPDFAWVYADGNDRARGYVLGALDTTAFELTLERDWWPTLRARYRTVPSNPLDQEIVAYVHRPPRRQVQVVEKFPSHLHIDMLPTVQGGGRGGAMIRTVLSALADAGSPGVHLGVAQANRNAIGFYEHLGFRTIVASSDADELVMGLEL